MSVYMYVCYMSKTLQFVSCGTRLFTEVKNKYVTVTLDYQKR